MRTCTIPIMISFSQLILFFCILKAIRIAKTRICFSFFVFAIHFTADNDFLSFFGAKWFRFSLSMSIWKYCSYVCQLLFSVILFRFLHELNMYIGTGPNSVKLEHLFFFCMGVWCVYLQMSWYYTNDIKKLPNWYKCALIVERPS